MKTIEETRRELFEAWYKKRYGIRTGPWAHAEFCDALEVWLAALDAVCIVMPEQGDYECRSDIQAVIIGDCRAAIESTNLGLRVK